MSFQCLLPTFDPPRLKIQSFAERSNVVKALSPMMMQWNEDRWAALRDARQQKAQARSMPKSRKKQKTVQFAEEMRGSTTGSLPTSSSADSNGRIELFEGNIQYQQPNGVRRTQQQPPPPPSLPQHQLQDAAALPISSRKTSVKPPTKPVNAFQRLLNNSSLLTAASSEYIGDDADDADDTGNADINDNLNTNKISIAEVLNRHKAPASSSAATASGAKTKQTASSKRKRDDSTTNNQTPAARATKKDTNPTAAEAVQPKAKRQKTTTTTSRVSSSAESILTRGPSSHGTLRDHILPTSATFQAQDFQNVQFFCRNAGSTEEVLQDFQAAVLRTGFVGISLLWADLSSNHAPLSEKYCTPSSHCAHWNCVCDKHIRAEYISGDRTLGAIVYLPATATATVASGEQASSAVASGDACFFLPLVRCVEPTISSKIAPTTGADAGVSQSPALTAPLPLKCATTLQQRIQALHVILTHPTVTKVMFNAQLCAVALSSLGPETITASTVTHINDPKVAAYLLSPEIDDASSLDLTSMLAKHHIAINHSATFTCDPSQIITKGRIAEAIYHTKAELIAICQLAKYLVQLLQEQQLTSVFQNLEMPLSFQLGTLEALGVAMDFTKLSILREQLEHQLRVVTQEIYTLSTIPQPQFNIASPEQISHLLFQHLRLKPPKSALETSTGKFLSTSEETLKQMKDQHPIVEWILTFRSLFKLLHTYIEGLEPFISTTLSVPSSSSSSSSTSLALYTSSVHASWNQLIVRTGRLSCSKPNMQNIPTNFSLPQLSAAPEMHDIRIRSFFIARTGYKLIAVDYSQIEMRVLAHVTGDMEMCGLFRDRGGDIYKLLASKIFRKATLDAVTDAERTQAKVICLGCIYGMGPVAAAARLGIDVATVSHITTSFFRSFRGVSQWIQRIRQYARTHQEVRTLSGRLRRLLDIHSENPIKRAAAERQAVNTVIQGTASDLIKSAMLLVSRSLAQWEDQWLMSTTTTTVTASASPSPAATGPQRARIIMQIHDELILEVPVCPVYQDGRMVEGLTHVDTVIGLVRYVMEEELTRRWQLKVPLLTTIRIGDHWGDMAAWNPTTTTSTSSSSSSSSVPSQPSQLSPTSSTAASSSPSSSSTDASSDVVPPSITSTLVATTRGTISSLAHLSSAAATAASTVTSSSVEFAVNESKTVTDDDHNNDDNNGGHRPSAAVVVLKESMILSGSQFCDEVDRIKVAALEEEELIAILSQPAPVDDNDDDSGGDDDDGSCEVSSAVGDDGDRSVSDGRLEEEDEDEDEEKEDTEESFDDGQGMVEDEDAEEDEAVVDTTDDEPTAPAVVRDATEQHTINDIASSNSSCGMRTGHSNTLSDTAARTTATVEATTIASTVPRIPSWRPAPALGLPLSGRATNISSVRNTTAVKLASMPSFFDDMQSSSSEDDDADDRPDHSTTASGGITPVWPVAGMGASNAVSDVTVLPTPSSSASTSATNVAVAAGSHISQRSTRTTAPPKAMSSSSLAFYCAAFSDDEDEDI